MVEPVDPFERGELAGLEGSPGSSPMDHLGLVEAVDRVGERIVVRVADAADRRLDAGVRKVWRDGYRYGTAGVVTVDLVPLATSQRALIGGLDREKGMALMAVMDACNRRWGRGTVVPAAAGGERKRTWSTKFKMRSPRYTTRVDELPVVRAA